MLCKLIDSNKFKTFHLQNGVFYAYIKNKTACHRIFFQKMTSDKNR